MKPMKYSQNALSLVEKFEGCELQAYQDEGGVWTIGYGHTQNVYPGMKITLEEAEEYAKDDLEVAQIFVNRLVTVPLSQGEFDALTDFVFNLGPVAFQKSTMLQLLNCGEYHLAAAQFNRWDRCGGKVVAGLLNRRKMETALFNSSGDLQSA